MNDPYVYKGTNDLKNKLNNIKTNKKPGRKAWLVLM